LSIVHKLNLSQAHDDAVWGVSWANADDRVISVSADGMIKYLDSTSGQVTRTLPRHTLGLTSLSTSLDGRQALFNSIEGLTQLWDLNSGEIIGKYESYLRTGTEAVEPCTFASPSLGPQLTHKKRGLSHLAQGGRPTPRLVAQETLQYTLQIRHRSARSSPPSQAAETSLACFVLMCVLRVSTPIFYKHNQYQTLPLES
jgi:hypothetical protein